MLRRIIFFLAFKKTLQQFLNGLVLRGVSEGGKGDGFSLRGYKTS